jgi:alkylation response protein AidB-like acyl-CoA dehydrogenase
MSINLSLSEQQTATSVVVITDDAQALQIARDLASQFKQDSSVRDRERHLPHQELEQFSRSGLWGISVPKTFGGAGVSYVTLAEVTRIISQADSSLGQIPQNHFYALEVLRQRGATAAVVRRGPRRPALGQRTGRAGHRERPWPHDAPES